MGTMSVPSRTLCLTLEVVNGDIWFLTERDWGQKSYCGNNTKVVICFFYFVMDIYGAKFQEHCFNNSRDIVYSVFTTFQLHILL